MIANITNCYALHQMPDAYNELEFRVFLLDNDSRLSLIFLQYDLNLRLTYEE